MIDYTKKITIDRQFYPINDIEYSIESDRGRILTAPALRRLQKRTQVFPLELNAAVRSRLTHSLEVQQNARYIAKSILKKLQDDETFESSGLKDLENAFVSISEMTALMHDIGNPPFGHFAEMTINDWMSTNAKNLLDDIVKSDSALKEKILIDISNFDGNAQAIRVATKLQRLNLSYSQIASVIKYTRVAYKDKPSKESHFSYLMKKPGFYLSEEDFVKQIYETLDIDIGCRFPITYIMESADDISYLNADIEDAVDKGILSFKDVYTLIKDECEKRQETYLLDIVNKYYEKVMLNEDEPYQFNLFWTLTRAALTSDLVKHVTKVYVDNHDTVFNGTFNSSLLEYDLDSKYTKAIQILQDISFKYIYSNKDVQTLELKGYKIINSLLDIYSPILRLTSDDMLKLLEDKKIDCFISMRLFKRLSSKHIAAYKVSVKSIDTQNDEEYKLLEWYYRARLILDYISGMTDDFALNEHQILNAI
jgi:dGTPase